MGDLAQRCKASKSAITQRVARAETAGLVHTTRAADTPSKAPPRRAPPGTRDRRALWVALTAKGQDWLDTTVEALLTHEDSLIDGLSDADIDTLSNGLRRLLHVLEDRAE